MELVVILIILGILAVFVVSRLDFSDTFDQRAALDKLKASLQYARKAAVAQRRFVCATLTANDATFTIDTVAPDGRTAVCGTTALPLAVADKLRSSNPVCSAASNRVCMPSGVTLSFTPAATPATVVFDAQGVTASSLSISVTGLSSAIVVEGGRDMSVSHCGRSRARGLTLIELIVFIVIVSVALVGILSVLNMTVFRSADPMVRKQLLSIAESLLEEVEAMPFTYCDPDDANAATATSATVGGSGCAATIEGLGVEGAEVRTTFDNVSDYQGVNLIPASSADGNTYPGYSAAITVANDAALGPAAGLAPSAAVLRITVQACQGATLPCPATAESVTLHGYRARHSPNALP